MALTAGKKGKGKKSLLMAGGATAPPPPQLDFESLLSREYQPARVTRLKPRGESVLQLDPHHHHHHKKKNATSSAYSYASASHHGQEDDGWVMVPNGSNASAATVTEAADDPAAYLCMRLSRAAVFEQKWLSPAHSP